MDDSLTKKVEELKRITKTDDDILIKSPLLNNPKTNPCIKEQNLRMKCMKATDFNGAACKDSAENYKLCQDFWTMVKTQRKARGIKPHLPEPEDRPRIKKEVTEEILAISKGEIPYVRVDFK